MYNAFISYSHAADGKLAPAVQSGLERFAKPWFKKRNLNVFRDEASLTANPHLWTNIQKALEQSEYMIYMASPVSASSKWVQKEIEYWIEHKSIDKLLIVLTDGEISWDDQNKIFFNANTNSLPAILENKLTEQPFYIDLRHIRSQEDLSLQNPLFKKEILKLAAPVHGKEPKDLASEEVTVHRKMIRIRNAAVSILGLLLVAALVLGLFANAKRREANEKTILAEKNAKEARDNLREFKQEEFKGNFKNGNTYLEAEEYNFAKECFSKAQETANDTLYNDSIPKKQISYVDSVLKVCDIKAKTK